MDVWTSTGMVNAECQFVGGFQASKANFEWRVQAQMFVSPHGRLSTLGLIDAGIAQLLLQSINAQAQGPALDLFAGTDALVISGILAGVEQGDVPIDAAVAALQLLGQQANVQSGPNIAADVAALLLTGQTADQIEGGGITPPGAILYSGTDAILSNGTDKLRWI